MTAKMRNAILTSVGSEKDVAARLGVSKSTVGKTRRKHGVKPHGWADVVRMSAIAARLRKEGKTYAQISKIAKIPISTAFKWCMDASLPKVKRPYRRLIQREAKPVASPAEWVTRALKRAEAAK